jgi:hypothetical protein
MKFAFVLCAPKCLEDNWFLEALVKALTVQWTATGRTRDLNTAIYFLDFIHHPYVFQPQRFEGRLFPRHQANVLWWDRSIELASTGGVGHLMTREEPFLETLWLKNIRDDG